MKTDKDTSKELEKGRKLKDFVEDGAWKNIRRQLIYKIMDLQSVGNIDWSKEDAKIEGMARNMAVDILFNWLKEVEGRKDQYDYNKIVNEEIEFSFINRDSE